jgi:hypothetical protein
MKLINNNIDVNRRLNIQPPFAVKRPKMPICYNIPKKYVRIFAGSFKIFEISVSRGALPPLAGLLRKYPLNLIRVMPAQGR